MQSLRKMRERLYRYGSGIKDISRPNRSKGQLLAESCAKANKAVLISVRQRQAPMNHLIDRRDWMHDSLNLMNASSAFISPSADRAGKLRPFMQISLPQVASMLFAYSPC
jgi:hypothetical protein